MCTPTKLSRRVLNPLPPTIYYHNSTIFFVYRGFQLFFQPFSFKSNQSICKAVSLFFVLFLFTYIRLWTIAYIFDNSTNVFDYAIHPFRTSVPFWGQTSRISNSLSPKRDCGSKGVNSLFYTWYTIIVVSLAIRQCAVRSSTLITHNYTIDTML